MQKGEVSNLKFFSQLFVVGIVLWVSAILYPNYVIIYDTRTLILTTIACSVISAFLSFILAGTLFMLLMTGRLLSTIIIAFFSSTIVCYISILAAETYISGFQITSALPRLIIATIIAIATTRETVDKASY